MGQGDPARIRSNRIKDSYGNRADDDVEKYDYDMIFDNDCHIEELESEFMKFWTQEMIAMSRTRGETE